MDDYVTSTEFKDDQPQAIIFHIPGNGVYFFSPNKHKFARQLLHVAPCNANLFPTVQSMGAKSMPKRCRLMTSWNWANSTMRRAMWIIFLCYNCIVLALEWGTESIICKNCHLLSATYGVRVLKQAAHEAPLSPHPTASSALRTLQRRTVTNLEEAATDDLVISVISR